MEALLIAILGIGWTTVFALIGYIFRTVPKLRADLTGMRMSYEREKERVAEMGAVERDAKQAALIGQAVARALGRLPEQS